MVKIGYTASELELLALRQVRFGGSKKVGVHRRKAGGKIYESPRITLDRHFMDLVAKKYQVYRGRGRFNSEGYGSVAPWSMEGDVLVLFFPDKWNKGERSDDEG